MALQCAGLPAGICIFIERVRDSGKLFFLQLAVLFIWHSLCLILTQCAIWHVVTGKLFRMAFTTADLTGKLSSKFDLHWEQGAEACKYADARAYLHGIVDGC